jgi:hypothetical protein
MEIKKCAHCGCDVVLGIDHDIEEATAGNPNLFVGCIPAWLYDLNSKEFSLNTTKEAICLICANTII